MPETSTTQLVEDVDAAIRDAYHALRTALLKVEDLKMKIIRQPDVNPFGQEHEEMYEMYLDLSKRFQATREEIRDRPGLVQPRPPTPGPPAPITPITDEPPPVEKPPVQRGKSRPYVLVPPRKSVFNTPAPPPSGSTSRRKRVVATRASGSLKGKRKAVGPKDEESSDSEAGIVHSSPTKRMKTRHTRREVDDKVDDAVLMVEDSGRWSSPLTDLSSASPVPPLIDAPPPSKSRDNPAPALTPAPVQEPESVPLRELAPEPRADRESQRTKPETPHTVLEPPPTVVPASTVPIVASGSQADEAKASVSPDKKPKLKGKKKGGSDSQFTMDDTLLDKRLLAVGPDFGVHNDRITHQQVGPNTRATMSNIFGGNPQRMISYPSLEKKRAHGFKSPLLFPSRKFNPRLPTRIGERGLLFRLDQKLERWADNEGGDGPYQLMMHHTPDDYCYFGVYKFVRVDPVTKDEWLAQLSQVKENWTNHALKTYTGEQTRARVFLRRDLGREPTKAEVDAAKGDKSLKTRVTAAQVMEDFNSGAEQLVIWGMKCIGYNYAFEKFLADNLGTAHARTKGK